MIIQPDSDRPPRYEKDPNDKKQRTFCIINQTKRRQALALLCKANDLMPDQPAQIAITGRHSGSMTLRQMPKWP